MDAKISPRTNYQQQPITGIIKSDLNNQPFDQEYQRWKDSAEGGAQMDSCSTPDELLMKYTGSQLFIIGADHDEEIALLVKLYESVHSTEIKGQAAFLIACHIKYIANEKSSHSPEEGEKYREEAEKLGCQPACWLREAASGDVDAAFLLSDHFPHDPILSIPYRYHHQAQLWIEQVFKTPLDEKNVERAGWYFERNPKQLTHEIAKQICTTGNLAAWPESVRTQVFSFATTYSDPVLIKNIVANCQPASLNDHERKIYALFQFKMGYDHLGGYRVEKDIQKAIGFFGSCIESDSLPKKEKGDAAYLLLKLKTLEECRNMQFPDTAKLEAICIACECQEFLWEQKLTVGQKEYPYKELQDAAEKLCHAFLRVENNVLSILPHYLELYKHFSQIQLQCEQCALGDDCMDKEPGKAATHFLQALKLGAETHSKLQKIFSDGPINHGTALPALTYYMEFPESATPEILNQLYPHRNYIPFIRELNRITTQQSALEHYFEGKSFAAHGQYIDAAMSFECALDMKLWCAEKEIQLLFKEGRGIDKRNINLALGFLGKELESIQEKALYQFLTEHSANQTFQTFENKINLLVPILQKSNPDLMFSLLKKTADNHIPGALHALTETLIDYHGSQIPDQWHSYLKRAADELEHANAAYLYGKILQKKESAPSIFTNLWSRAVGEDARHYFHIAAKQNNIHAQQALVALGDKTYAPTPNTVKGSDIEKWV